MLQWIVVSLVVPFATGYVVWIFLPLARRQAMLDTLAARGLLRGAASRHRARLATPGCSHCAPGTQSLHHPMRSHDK